jgi:3-hydroxyacyl-CoA dehydrogenase
MTKIAVIGTGLIGRSWAIVFARAGFSVSLWDSHPPAVNSTLEFIARRLPELAAHGLLQDRAEAEVMSLLTPAATLEEALGTADYVQENGPERVEDKRDLFARMDAIAPAGAILASSTSAIRASAFTEGLAGRARCLVAHPVNPPYLIPLVELSPAPWTAPETVTRAGKLLEQAGMVTAVVKREINGFILNRLQAALLTEALYLVEEGIADPADIDVTVKDGLGLRWAFMGPFETIDLNAPGGLVDYCARYGGSFRKMMQESSAPSWSPATIEALNAAQRAHIPVEAHAARQEWRDRRLMALLSHKAAQKP